MHLAESWKTLDLERILKHSWISFFVAFEMIPDSGFKLSYIWNGLSKLQKGTMHFFPFLQRTSLAELIYMADNLAYFPYTIQDEPLYIIHQIDILVSVSGSNLMQSFQEVNLQSEPFVYYRNKI